MSADFLCAICDDPVEDEGMFRKLVVEDIDQMVANDRFDSFVRSLADTWGELDDVEGMGEARDMLIERAVACHKYLKKPAYDFARVRLKGSNFLISGGMSYGDSPTEACDAIWFLANSGWDRL